MGQEGDRAAELAGARVAGAEGPVVSDSGLRDPDGLVGKLVGGKYRVIDVLARGGMGRIYLAQQVALERPVALKVLHSELDELQVDSGFQRRFLLEAATCARLQHPNIVVVYDYGKIEDSSRESYFIAMELLEGRTLGAVLRERGPIEIARALRITREVARALREAHRQGVVHRDLKPSNVMLVPTGEGEAVKVLDFGLVKLMRDDSEELTKEGHFLGSPKYMAPEQIKRHPIDGRADLYSLGILFYQMLTGRVPFEGDQPVQTLMAHLTDPVPPLPPDLEIPGGIQAILVRLLEKQPQHRWNSASSLIQAIDQASASVPGWSYEPGSISADATLGDSNSGSLRFGTGEHARVSYTPHRHSRPARARTKRALVAASAVVLAAALGGTVAVLAGPSTESARHANAAEPQVPVVPAPAPTAEPAASASNEAASPVASTPSGRFTLFVESTPTNAVLRRDEEVIGRTPTFVELDADSVRSAPAAFRVESPGFAPYLWSQGPAADDVRIAARLRPLAPRGSRAPGGTARTDPEGRPMPEHAGRPNVPPSARPSAGGGDEFAIKTRR